MTDKDSLQSALPDKTEKSDSKDATIRDRNNSVVNPLGRNQESQDATRATKRKILFFGLNPQRLTEADLGKEMCDIQEGLDLSTYRNDFEFIQYSAVRFRDFQRAVLDKDAQIIHFSGHVKGKPGLYFEDESGNPKAVNSEGLTDLCKLFPSIECVVLSGCYEKRQAEAIAQCVPYVVTIPRTLERKAAIEFSVAFYDALGAGNPVEFAVDFAKAATALFSESDQPTVDVPLKNSSFVEAERQKEILSITQFLLEARKNDKKNVIILWGPEGYGKTDLAKEIVSKEDIQSHFKKGLFWLDCQGEAFEEELQSIYDRNISSDLSIHSGLITAESNQQEDSHCALIVLDHMQDEPDNFETIYKNSSARCAWFIISDQYKSYLRYSKAAGVEENKLDIHVQTPLSAQTYARIILRDLEDAYNLTDLTVQDEIDLLDKIDYLVTKIHSFPSYFPKIRIRLAELAEMVYRDCPKEALVVILEELKDRVFLIQEQDCNSELLAQAEVLSVFRRGADIPLSMIRKISQQNISFVNTICHNLYKASLLDRFVPGKLIRLNKPAYEEIREMVLKDAETNSAVFHERIVDYYMSAEPDVHNALCLYNNKTKEMEDSGSIFSDLGSLDDIEKNYLIDFYSWHVEELTEQRRISII